MTAHAGPSTPRLAYPSTSIPTPSSDRKSFVSISADSPSSSPLSQTAVFEYPVDSYDDIDAERGVLLPSSDVDRAPWAAILERVQRSLLRLPGVERTVDGINWILGPTERRPPPPPTSMALTCALTGGRKRLSVPLDAVCVRASRRAKLRHFYLLYLAFWAAGFVLLIRAAYYQPGSPPSVSCTASMWDDWPPDNCGLGMEECAAMLEEGTYRCPGGCQLVNLGNPRWVGSERVSKRPLVIGGGDGVYRADSWVCAAGIHAGLISTTYGGCLRIKPRPYPVGSSNFLNSTSHGLTSTPFQPRFPGAFELESSGSWAGCMDYHWPLTVYNVLALFIFTTLFFPRPAILTTVVLVMGYAHVVLVSDPPSRPPNWSRVIQGVPPVLLAGYWAWHIAFRRSLGGFYNAGLPLEVAIWQGLGLWIGLESSTLFSKIPISRLGYGSLGADGVVALIVVVALVAIVVLIQALSFRRLGLVRYYVARYLPLVPLLLILANLGHDYYLRLHHYFLSLAGIPVMSLPNRISLFGSAFCLGFFLDGVGRWGWASMLEGGAALLGDAVAGSLIPEVSSGPGGLSWPAINGSLVEWGIRSVAVLLDDVLVADNYTSSNFSLGDTVDRAVDHYFRIAYIGNGTSLDYSDPLTWYAASQSWAANTASH